MNKLLVVVNGEANCGKDTVADYLDFMILEDLGIKINKLSNAQQVKKVAMTSFYWNGEKDERGRTLLQMITKVGYDYDPHFWDKISLQKDKEVISNKLDNLRFYNEESKKTHIAVITDCRYYSTIDLFLKNGYKVLAVRVDRDIDNGLTEEQKSHEQFNVFNVGKIDHTKYTPYRIENNGDLSNLKLETRVLVDYLKGLIDIWY